jgi:rhodanese-related sulfurtransferase
MPFLGVELCPLLIDCNLRPFLNHETMSLTETMVHLVCRCGQRSGLAARLIRKQRGHSKRRRVSNMD